MVKRFPHGKPARCATRVGVYRGGDGYPLQYTQFTAATHPHAALVCIHGIQSHAGWYRNSSQAFAQAGYETYFFDRRGSGRNARDRGHCTGHQQLVDDVRLAVEHVRTRHPDLPVVLQAISWGGKLAVATLQEHPRLVDGLVLICPGWFAKVDPTLREKLAVGWSFLFWPKRMINVPLSDPSLFTSCSHWQKFIREEPLGLRQATARTLMTSKILDFVIKKAPPKIDVPSLLMLAGKDRIIDNTRTSAFFDRFGSEDRSVLEYPEAHHTFEFEANADAIFEDIIGWMGKRFGEKPAAPQSQQPALATATVPG